MLHTESVYAEGSSTKNVTMAIELCKHLVWRDRPFSLLIHANMPDYVNTSNDMTLSSLVDHMFKSHTHTHTHSVHSAVHLCSHHTAKH